MQRNEDTPNELFIYSDIGESSVDLWTGQEIERTSASFVVAELANLGNRDLDVRIISDGGDSDDGIGIYEALKRYPGKVRTFNDGMAASAASIIYLAGDERYISRAGLIMIHGAAVYTGFGPYTAGELRDFAGILETLNDTLVDLYVHETKLSRKKVEDYFASGDTYLKPKEAIKYGFAHSITGEEAEKPVNLDTVNKLEVKLLERRLSQRGRLAVVS